jgi:hypothetical protein
MTRPALDASVPANISGHFETLKNLCLYGWFVYSFYTAADTLTYSAIEMALRFRFKADDPDGHLRLKELLERAVTSGLIPPVRSRDRDAAQRADGRRRDHRHRSDRAQG